MKNICLCLAFLISSAALSAANFDIVPKPAGLTAMQGHFEISAATQVVVPRGDEALMKTARIFAADMEKVPGVRMAVKEGRAGGKGTINTGISKSLGEEEYTLDVSPQKIDIAGGSARAVMYGFQTLKQLIFGAGAMYGIVRVPAVKIEDKPAFEYRGAMLDAGRYFYSVDDVKTFIDMLALHKMNKFHFHLTDDQGWRIEIKMFPELTRTGSLRKGTHEGHYYDKRWDMRPYGGFYTQDQIRDIVLYAADRHIDVIPEIEFPGHATAALASYQWLGCLQGGYEVSIMWGVHKELFCAGRESTFEFLEGVLEEVIELFPYEYIHIGGDECPKERWKACPECQKRITANGLKDEEALQGYFVQRMEKWLNQRGKTIVGWDEILEGGGMSKTAVVMSWRGTKGGLEAAQRGNRVIMAPNIPYYLDYYQASPETEPLTIFKNRINTIEKVYAFDPCAGLEESQRQYVWGVQGNLWTEYIANMAYAEYMLLPRLAAVAETGWTYNGKDYADFVGRMQTFRRVYDANGYNYAKHIYPAE